MTTTTAAGLALRLREATAAEHRDTESRTFVTRLMEGSLDLDAYARYLAQYAYVYRALESRPANPDDPGLIDDPALDRFETIASDLGHLGAADWETSHPALRATQRYVERIEDSYRDLPRFIAHHYTRYLGDLSGGQTIAKRVTDHYGATPDQLSFYRFERIDRPGPYKVSYREGLDALGFSDEEEGVLIDEAKRAFRCNAELFDALDGG